MEINIDPLYQILRAYQRTNSHNLLFHLQKKTANKIGTYITNSKSAAFLSVFYDQQISMTSSVQHTFRIPIRLLKKDSDDRIQEPRSGDPALLLRLSKNITYLYKRIDRYKKAKHITLTVTKGGELSINIDHELRDVSMVWKKPLPIPAHSFDDVSSDSISLTLKLRDWKKGAKIAELSKTLMMMFLENQALVLHAFMDDEKKSEVLFYAGAFNA
ncbi:unnamed protein product [Kuraishia capsulata CBS 1993]|uniref:Checkpoint protein n=1 Tax=Kuraishia capsulata CBS 1993 TaxID=1382522 RepID=W6MNW4_9ASCO|nr:uncharacterized protein KUCA_T00002726001 [Kuraishia capsulata CBS 1993]CDK26752.1 unnamed protein product [Kuraishia capsulata CBS 1993]